MPAAAKPASPTIKILHDLDNPKLTESAIKKGFARLGANVVIYEAGKLKRSAGISFQEVSLTFADSQQVTLRIKQSGDVYQALLNGKAVPLRSMDNDTLKTIEELEAAMNKGRIPASIKITKPKREQLLIEKRDALKEAIAAVDEELAKVENLVSSQPQTASNDTIAPVIEQMQEKPVMEEKKDYSVSHVNHGKLAG